MGCADKQGVGACVCYPAKLFSAFWLSAHSTVKSYTNSSNVRLKNLSNPVRNAPLSHHKQPKSCDCIPCLQTVCITSVGNTRLNTSMFHLTPLSGTCQVPGVIHTYYLSLMTSPQGQGCTGFTQPVSFMPRSSHKLLTSSTHILTPLDQI